MNTMKQLFLILVVALFSQAVHAQKLVDLYKKGVVKLVPDPEYGKGNNWNKVFENYLDTLYGKPMGDRKNITLMPDGSIVVSHQYRDFFSLFSPNGKFVKEFGVKNSKGVPFKKINRIEGINRTVFYTGLDNMGNMVCFDFSGNYVKTLKLDYMAQQMITLPNNKIAVVGWVLWKEKIREFVSIVNFDTNEEKVIWEHYTDRDDARINEHTLFNYSYGFREKVQLSPNTVRVAYKGAISFSTMPYTKSTGMSARPIIATTGNQLVVAVPSTGEINIYNQEGNKLGSQKVSWPNSFISVEEQKKIQLEVIEKFKNLGNSMFSSLASPEENIIARDTIISQMYRDLPKIKDPIPIPSISTILKDSDGNLLFFEYPKKQNANKFNVWVMQDGGKFVCQSSFLCDEYELNINPSKMVFRDGMIYGLQKLKKADGIPLRLARFRLE